MKSLRMVRLVCPCLAVIASLPIATGHETSGLLQYKDGNTGLTILRATVTLPTPGHWTVSPDAATANPQLREVFLHPADPAEAQLLDGRRISKRKELQEIAQGASNLNNLGWGIERFTKEHNGDAPRSLDDLKEAIGEYSLKKLVTDYHVFPDRMRMNTKQAAPDARIVAFETAPAVDDGMHWILLSNGTTERRAIDPQLASVPGVTIKPHRPKDADTVKDVTYTVHARLMQQSPIRIPIQNTRNHQTSEISLNPGHAKPGERDLLGDWAKLRMLSLPIDEDFSSAILPHWLRQTPELYGTSPELLHRANGLPFLRDRDRDSSIFHVLGGRAAISETLQMQDITAPTGTTSDKPNTPIRDIPGVEVKSHPFDEMLGAQPGGRIPLADVIPANRLFAYFPKPAGLIGWLDGGAKFLLHAGGSSTGRTLEYGLSERYISALGMEREWMRRLLDSGAVEEIAIALPDLFLIEGTEITTVARLKNPVIATGLLKLIGIQNLDSTTVRKTADGSSYWAKRGDLLVISTHPDELEKVLALEANGGKGSLGHSAEMKYMLTKLPLHDSTRTFVYLSDPFIRRLVGPETKIPQHRRIRARSEMEAMVAGSLLYQLDGHSGGTAADMISKKYIPTPLIATDAILDPKAGAVSPTFGPLARMNSLLDLNITTATEEETNAYRQYLENYNQYWRRYFDPIAIRVDQPKPSEYELSVFILPLIDNSLYNSLRELITDKHDAAALKIPVIQPEPIATLSMNLSEKAWVDAGGDLLEGFFNNAGLDTSILDYLGPDVHFSLADADPILEIGSGEITQLFGTMANGNDMVMISTLISLFTRPTAISIGLSDPDAVRRALDSSLGNDSRTSGFFDWKGNLHKLPGKDRWVYQLQFFNLMTLRLGVDVQDRFLVIRNMPLTSQFRVTGIREATQPGAQIQVSPRACRLQLPALFSSAAERERSAAFSGISDLYPILLARKGTLLEAKELHKAWFGFQPVHPDGGAWEWDGQEMSSNRYGTRHQPTQPDYQSGNRDFGILRQVDRGEVGMRFEDDGLRTTLRWYLRTDAK